MKQRIEIENLRAIIANIEMAMRNSGHMSPERKAWFMGARAALSWVLGHSKGARMVEFMLRTQSVEGLVNPFVGSQALDAQNNPKPE